MLMQQTDKTIALAGDLILTRPWSEKKHPDFLNLIEILRNADVSIANLDTLILRVYITGSQLTSIDLRQKVFVYIDQKDDSMMELEGTVSWISSQAEFTPKIIQTKEERVNLVYAVKILVKNDGSLKIGMPGEVRFQSRK